MATTSSKDVFPRRNLPGEAERWGRDVENRIEAGEDSETQLSQVVNNMGRATAGQLAVLSRQVTELGSHRTWLTNPADLNLTVIASGTTYTKWYSGLRNVVFPAPEGGGRNALFSLSAFITSTANAGIFSAVVTGVRYKGDYVYRSQGSYVSSSGGQSQPPGWTASSNVIVPVQVPAGESPVFEFELRGSMFGTGTFVVSAENISGILQYGDLTKPLEERMV